MKISAIFSDYDGTLSPFNVPREEAVIPKKLYNILAEISKYIPLCIITTKSVDFIKSRIAFTDAIASMCGIEININNKSIIDKRIYEKEVLLRKMCRDAESIGIEHLFVEQRKTSDGTLAAFCIDWRLTRDWSYSKSMIEPVLNRCRSNGLYVVTYSTHPFADIYSIEVNKGRALNTLKHELRIRGNVLYLGDSESDNAAFEASDLAIGIKHELDVALQCDYSLPFAELESFLCRLLESGMEFDPSLIR